MGKVVPTLQSQNCCNSRAHGYERPGSSHDWRDGYGIGRESSGVTRWHGVSGVTCTMVTGGVTLILLQVE